MINQNGDKIDQVSMIYDSLEAHIWNANFENDFSADLNDEF